MMKTMTLSQILIFWLLTFTTVIGGLIYLGYLGIVYRMDRADPIVGQQIRAREAAVATRDDARREFGLRLICHPLFWGSILGFLVVRFCMVNF